MIGAWVTGGYSDNHTPFGISLHQNEEAHIEAAKTPEQRASEAAQKAAEEQKKLYIKSCSDDWTKLQISTTF